MLGYIGAFEKRCGDRFDGCATFFKASKFKMVQRHRVEYRMDGISLMDRDNVGLILILERQQSTAKHRRGRNTESTTPTLFPQSYPKICVANTHLLYNPKRGDIKLAQLSKLFAEIDQLTSANRTALNITTQSTYAKDDNHRRRHCPIILCGDFNSSPTSSVIQFVSQGSLQYPGLNRKIISGQRRESTRHSDPICDDCILQRGTLPPWGLNVNNSCKYEHQIDPEIHQNYDTILHHLNLASIYHYGDDHVTTTEQAVDYIFYSNDRVYAYPNSDTASSGSCSNTSYRIRPVSYLNLYTKEHMNKMPCLPNMQLSSDHICLLSKLSYLASNTE